VRGEATPTLPDGSEFDVQVAIDVIPETIPALRGTLHSTGVVW
jgi:hypothetical protein